MTIDAYLNPDFTTTEQITFFLMALLGIILCVLVILGGVRLTTYGLKKSQEGGPFLKDPTTVYSDFMR